MEKWMQLLQLNKKLNFLKGTLGENQLEIPLNLTLEKCEFCEKWDFENVNFVKIEALKMWISGELRL